MKRYGRWIGYVFMAAVMSAGWWCDVGQFKYHHHSCWCTRDPFAVNARMICTMPQNYAPAKVREAATYLLETSSATEDDKNLANQAIEWLRAARRTASGLGAASGQAKESCVGEEPLIEGAAAEKACQQYK